MSTILKRLLLILASWLLFGRIASSETGTDCSNIADEIVYWIESGHLSRARLLALESLHNSPECKSKITTIYKNTSDKVLPSTDYFLKKLKLALNSSVADVHRTNAKHDTPDCVPDVIGSMGDATTEWDECCSILPRPQKEDSLSFGSSLQPVSECFFENPCCEFYIGSQAHLRLPALHEPAIRIRIPRGKSQRTTVELEQDGYLRPFEVSTILWPSGYLLAQCLANPIACQIPEMHRAIERYSKTNSSSPVAIELGAGIGAASISFALHLQDHLQGGESNPLVLATDVAPHSLALTMGNAHWNHANIAVHQMNHTNISSIREVKSKYFPTGVPIIFGSSLQAIFHESHKPESLLWKALDILLSSEQDGEVTAIFVHTKTERLLPPSDGTFVVVRRIDGDMFEMQTRKGDSSDFEVSVFKRASRINAEL